MENFRILRKIPNKLKKFSNWVLTPNYPAYAIGTYNLQQKRWMEIERERERKREQKQKGIQL